MNEELDLNLDELDQIDANADRKLQIKNRYQTLSDKVKAEGQAREQAEAKAKAEAEARTQAEKSLEFYKTFTKFSAEHPEAINYQDQILEKVNSGLSTEDATLLVLAREGKLLQAPAPQRTQGAEGGSAITNIADGDKPLNELNQNEKLTALLEMEKNGELVQALRAGINRS